MSPLILDIIVRDGYILGQAIYNLLLSRQQRAVCARSAGVERTEHRAYRKYSSRMGGFDEIYAHTFDARLNERLAAGLYDRENAGIPQEKSLTEPGPFEGGKSGMGVPGGVTEAGRGRGREGLPTADLVGLGAGTDETLR